MIIEYRDRPEGSESKLNTYSDGLKVLATIGRLFRNYKPMNFFGLLSAVLVLIAAALFIPVFWMFLQTGKVPNFPTLIVSGFVAMAALQSLFSGLILSTMAEKNRQEFELWLQLVNSQYQAKNNLK